MGKKFVNGTNNLPTIVFYTQQEGQKSLYSACGASKTKYVHKNFANCPRITVICYLSLSIIQVLGLELAIRKSNRPGEIQNGVSNEKRKTKRNVVTVLS